VAKKSKIVKNDQLRVMVARYADRRAELKAIIRSQASSYEQRLAAQRALARPPRDASPVRIRNRDPHPAQLPTWVFREDRL
jgi:small subunit ribosomal protein S14